LTYILLDEEKTEGEKLVINLQDAQDTLADKIEKSELQLFKNSAPLKATDLKTISGKEVSYTEEVDENGNVRRKAVFGDENNDDNEDEDDEDDEDDDEMEEDDDDEEEEDDDDDDEEEEEDDDDDGEAKKDADEIKRKRRRAFDKYDNEEQNDEEIAFAESDSEFDVDDDDDENGELNWKIGMAERAAANFKDVKRKKNLMQIVYDGSDSEESEESEEENNDDDELFVKVKPQKRVSTDTMDTSKLILLNDDLEDWSDEETIESLRYRFITGDGNNKNNNGNGDGEEDEVYGDFEDLETGEVVKAEDNNNDDDENNENEVGDDGLTEEERLAKKKEELKKKFDAEYDGEEEENDNFYEEIKSGINKQLELNRAEFEEDDPETRAKIEGYRPGQYVRILIKNLPCEFIEHFDPAYPVIVGGLLSTEEAFGFMQVRHIYIKNLNIYIYIYI